MAADTPIFLITGATGLIGFHALLAVLTAGYRVRYTARSDAKVTLVSSNPAIQKLSAGDRLSAVIIPDFTVDGAFDAALDGITHIIHVGSPVPLPTVDPVTDIFEPTTKISAGLLASALKSSTLQRIILTSSFVANLDLLPEPSVKATAASRCSLPNSAPASFGSVYEAYVASKLAEINAADVFMATHRPSFSIARIFPGFTFGRNELALDAESMCQQNSTNNFLMMALTGVTVPFPIHTGFAHIADVADLYLRVALYTPQPGPAQDFGIVSPVDYSLTFDYAAKAFPKACADGVFTRGQIPPLPVSYDASATEQMFGITFRSFESAVVDVAAQYLEILGKEKA